MVESYRRHPRACLYLSSAFIVLASFLTWYRFDSPPINSNTGFDLYPWREIGVSLSPFNPFIGGGSYTPWVLGSPEAGYYGLFYSATANSYSGALFASVVSVSVLGGVCLTALLIPWLGRFGVRPEYALLGVVTYAFNDYKLLSGFGTTDGFFSSGLFLATDPALLTILGYLTFLTLFRDRRFALLLGAFSFLAFSNFPTSSLVLVQEYLVLVAILVGLKWSSLSRIVARQRVRQITLDSGLIFAVIAAANVYLLYPFALVYRDYTAALVGSNPAYGFSYLFDANQSLSNALRLQTNWSVFTVKAPPWAAGYLTGPIPTLLSFLLPTLALGALWFLRRTSDLILYVLMLAAVWISASVNSPTGTLFVWFTTNVAPLRAFYNGETISPVVLLFYCLFAPLTVGRFAQALTARQTRVHARTIDGGSVSMGRRARINHLRGNLLAARLLPLVIAVLLVVSVYPALSPSFSASHAPDYPIDSSLPVSYVQASNYLQSADPLGTTMVFPEVEPYDSNAVNGSTWYYGINLYPNIIANPSISSESPANSVLGVQNVLPIPGFVYDIGGSVCASATCLDSGVSPLPTLPVLASLPGPEFVGANASNLTWSSGTPPDSLAFPVVGGQRTVEFQIAPGNSETNGHWLLRFLHPAQDLSRYSQVVIRFSAIGVNPSELQFGFHSGSDYGNGSGYLFGNVSVIANGTNDVAVIPLEGPSLRDNGSLDDVTNLFMVDEEAQSSSPASIDVMSLRFVTAPPETISDWTAGTQEDSVSLAAQTSGTTLAFGINQQVFEPNGHWMIGYFPEPIDLAAYSFAIINYTLSGVNPSFLQFGYHAGSEYGMGDGYPFLDYLTVHSGSNYTTIVPLQAPVLLDGGSLVNVTNLFMVYSPDSTLPAEGYVNWTSFRLASPVSSTGGSLASDLNRMGVEFAYVDTSVEFTNFPSFVGNYYNGIFGRSSYFEDVFHSGTVTIYRNLLYSGILSSAQMVAPIAISNDTVGGLSLPYASVYYNATNSGVAYVSGYGGPALVSLHSVNISAVQHPSTTQYTATVRVNGSGILELKVPFDGGWVARISNGTLVATHLEVDGYSNGWLLPGGNYTLTISLSGAELFAAVETVALIVPPALLVGFVVVSIRRRRRRTPSGAAEQS